MQHKRPRKTGKAAFNVPSGKPPAKPARTGQAPSRPSKGPAKVWNAQDFRPTKPWDRNAPAGRPGSPPLRKNAPRSMQVRTSHTGNPGKPGRPEGGAWGHTAPPSRTRLEELLNSHGVTMPATVLDKVWQYHQILRRNNADLDLTRLIGFETIVQRHYADCLILHKLMKGRWPSPLVDIGTGAGFPGLMIKLASPTTEVILSEPRNVRVDFLNNTIKELGLKGISVFGHKFTSKSFQTPVRGVITRAFEPITKTLPRLQYSLAVGGLAMFMKGPGVDEELSAPLPSGYKLVMDERYRIPRTTLDRAFVVFERTA
jgi:16S rRNA (guanine527-N7)-methyltransferase